MACGRTLERCIFCGGAPTTEEHLVADWVLRAFARSKKLRTSWEFLDPRDLQRSLARFGDRLRGTDAISDPAGEGAAAISGRLR